MGSDAIVIIGASAAGTSAAREIRILDKNVRVRMFSDESRYPYYRPLLTEYIGNAGVENRKNFYLSPDEWYRDKQIDLRLEEMVVAIDIEKKEITTARGETCPYGTLILANGSRPFVPIKDATSQKNVFSVRTIEDAKAIHAYAEKAKTAIVVGGGLLGIETAHSLIVRGLQVTIIEVLDRVLCRQLDPESSGNLQDLLARRNVRILLGKTVESIIGDGMAAGVRLATGEEVMADMIVFSIGIRSNIDLARSCGIRVNRSVVVNDRMETSIEGIFACGDVAEYNGRTPGLWMPAVKQGRVAGSNAAGGGERFFDDVYPTVLTSFGTRIFSAGDICNDKNKDDYRLYVEGSAENNNLKKLFFINNKLAGFILFGDISDSQRLTTAIKNGNTYNELAR
jgi:nitrite reductase (NADH) large subunit